MSALPPAASVPKPPIFTLANDFSRYGLTRSQANEILASRFNKRNGAHPQFVVLHIQDGTTNGSLAYWASSAVEASSTVMINKDGSILQIIGEEHGPWTNGDVIGPTAEAAEILALGGNPNIWSLTCEAEGKPDDAMPQVQLDAIVWWVEDCLMRYPAILKHTYSILRHGWINSATRSRCPGAYFDRVLTAINEWLDEGATRPQPPAPEPIPTPPSAAYPVGMNEALAMRLYGSVRVTWASKPFAFDEQRSECQYWLARGKLALARAMTTRTVPGHRWSR